MVCCDKNGSEPYTATIRNTSPAADKKKIKKPTGRCFWERDRETETDKA